MSLRYFNRLISDKLSSALDTFPAVILGGARQTGKSTILTHDQKFSDRKYYSCDSASVSLSLRSSSAEFLREHPRLTLDEAQHFPSIFLDIKQIVDRKRENGRFLLSGSAQFLLLKNIGDSLAGRAFYLRLFPTTIYEQINPEERPFLFRLLNQKRNRPPKPSVKAHPWKARWLLYGGFPSLIWDNADPALWFDAYEETYLERDLRDLSSGIDPFNFQRFLKITATRNGTLLNQADIAARSSLNAMTAGRYLYLLETTGIIFRIPPLFNNPTKRLTKRPKLIFTDVTFASHIAGMSHILDDPVNPAYDHALESFVLQNILALIECFPAGKVELFHYRTSSGFEIDAVLRYSNKLIAIEVKSSEKQLEKAQKNLKKFINENPECSIGIIAYRGKDIIPMGKKIWAVPIGFLLC